MGKRQDISISCTFLPHNCGVFSLLININRQLHNNMDNEQEQRGRYLAAINYCFSTRTVGLYVCLSINKFHLSISHTDFLPPILTQKNTQNVLLEYWIRLNPSVK